MIKSASPFDAPPQTPGAESDARLRHSPACGRNREPIAAVLERVLPESGLLLEISAGTGEHAVYFARRFPGLTWQPSDPNPEMRASIAAWTEKVKAETALETGAENILPPLDLDVTEGDWPLGRADAVFSANMIHIAPWDCCEGLMAGAGKVLTSSGILIIYGPFKRDGRHTAASNEAFDDSLRGRNAAWGIRDLGDVAEAARAHGLMLTETHDMPANNLTVVFRKSG